ncbi:MAG: UvrD-helicase domain-containing protein [Deltaproteobacteria bacterium]|nr:UvrD-helicase domain-containing protein [Deltaproteobacteria bacterium]
MNYLDGLNGKQREAVEYGNGPLLVLAGAGSGKTRVLTHRIAHLIHRGQADPSQIFAVTFTNKAAGEMRKRVFGLLGLDESARNDLWVSTFHSACVRILRSDIHHLGFNNQFTIYDDTDQLSVVKACMKELNISESVFSPKALQSRINHVKNAGLDSESYQPSFGGPMEDVFIRSFQRYSEVLKQSSALDFADLILLTVKLLSHHPRVLAAYQERFHHLLIDEYQDTNRCQYQLMKLLAGLRANICAVGDEDQSIYRWRGADITNILNFEQDYPNTKIIKLEENYRSTKSIIEAASHVISNNLERREKTLWTRNAVGEKIVVIECYDEHDEAHKITNEVANCLAQDFSLNQLAVFYRTNAQSRLLEDMLRAKGIHYQIYGGLKFYERLEVKDALAYLKLLANPNDDVSFRRIVNVPPRGIGAVSLERFSTKAKELGVGHYELLQKIFTSGEISVDLGRARRAFDVFYKMMEEFREQKEKLLPSDLLNFILEGSEYRKSLQDEQTIEAQSRLENLAELRQSMVEYELRCGANNPDSPITLQGFLEEIALVSDIDRFDPAAPALKMMTIHMAKGLEFDVVFVTGLEEELFPNIRSWEAQDDSDIEEERRLFYVGMTRARKKLHLLYAKNRTVFGTSHFRVRSRFVDEIPKNYFEMSKADYFSRRRHYLDRPNPPSRSRELLADDFSQITQDSDGCDMPPVEDGENLRIGTHVRHPLFGEGVVRNTQGDKLIVEFKGRGMRKLSLKFAQLQIL